MPNRLTEKQKWGIVCLKDYADFSNSKIADAVSVRKSTVKKVLDRYRETGSVKDRAGRGRKKKLTTVEESFIITYVGRKPRATASELKHQIFIEYGLSVSLTLITSFLRKSGFRKRIARPVPFLSNRHSDERYNFAMSHQWKFLSWWKTVKFSDECSFELGKNGQIKVWRKKGERNDSRFLNPTKRSGRVSVMIWGIISYEGIGPMKITEGRFNSAKYLDILRNDVTPFMNGGIFMQDNAPIHTARICS